MPSWAQACHASRVNSPASSCFARSLLSSRRAKAVAASISSHCSAVSEKSTLTPCPLTPCPLLLVRDPGASGGDGWLSRWPSDPGHGVRGRAPPPGPADGEAYCCIVGTRLCLVRERRKPALV